MDWSWLDEPDIPNEPGDPREKEFHNWVRDYIVLFLILLVIYLVAYVVVSCYRRNRDEYYTDEEDAIVYRVSSWMCTFSLAISIGAALLLPFSVFTNEVLIIYPDNYYMQWLNDSLVQRLWDSVFLFSNLSLFVLLPFAYFFTESEGFSGSRKGITARVYETIVILILLIVLVLGMTYLLCLVLGYGQLGLVNLVFVWNYLPFLYSCVSFLGVLLLLVCTPVGIARLFTVLGELVVKPFFLRNIQDEYDVVHMKEMHLKRIIENQLKSLKRSPVTMSVTGNCSTPYRSSSMPSLDNFFEDSNDYSCIERRKPQINGSDSNGSLSKLQEEYEEAKSLRQSLESQKSTSRLRRNLVSTYSISTFLASLLLFNLGVNLIVS